VQGDETVTSAGPEEIAVPRSSVEGELVSSAMVTVVRFVSPEAAALSAWSQTPKAAARAVAQAAPRG